jgi:NADH-quinone oxidoreductase subunit N
MSPSSAELAALQTDLAHDLARFAPELVLAGTIVSLLVAKLFSSLDRVHLTPFAVAGTAVALGFLVWQFVEPTRFPDGPAFAGLLALDPPAGFVRAIVLTAALVVLTLGWITGLPDREDAADFGTLLLGATLGMLLMASANHLLIVFLAIEMASLPSYALAGFLKGKRAGSEAALKYVVYGAAASGVMLYGISLLAGGFGTGSMPGVAKGFAVAAEAGKLPLLTAIGVAFVLVGLAFKLSAVPFHFWLPDVFDGAATEVAAFLSVASKAAAVGLTVRFLLAFQAEAILNGPGVAVLPHSFGMAVLVVAAVTATLGNLAAMTQTNLKRLLAYSTIAHAGYVLMALATLTAEGAAAALFYMAAYLPMNLGAFAVAAVVRDRTGSETVDACRGLLARSPVLGVGLAVCVLGLLGLPPLAGFAGKFQVFAAVYDAGRGYAALGHPRLGTAYLVLLAVGVINTAVSAGYYLRLLRVATLDEPDADETGNPVPLGESPAAAALVGALAAAVVGLGVWWGPLAAAAAR